MTIKGKYNSLNYDYDLLLSTFYGQKVFQSLLITRDKGGGSSACTRIKSSNTLTLKGVNLSCSQVLKRHWHFYFISNIMTYIFSKSLELAIIKSKLESKRPCLPVTQWSHLSPYKPNHNRKSDTDAKSFMNHALQIHFLLQQPIKVSDMYTLVDS